MKEPEVYFLSLLEDTPCRGFWDYGLLEELLSEFNHKEVRVLPEAEFGIVVIPGRSHYKEVGRLNHELSKLSSVLLFIMGDEESVFPIYDIKHDNIKIWVQNPPSDLPEEFGKLGCGYPQDIHKCEKLYKKRYDWSFLGQVTHERRKECVEALKKSNGKGYLLESEAFTDGLDQAEYFKKMSQSKIAPCPAGPETVDTFRFFEALELGCVPIADEKTTKRQWYGFWEYLFGSTVPFPTIRDYDSLPGYIDDIKGRYPELNNTIQAWWLRQKRDLFHTIESDIFHLTGNSVKRDTTIIVPVSPIKSHPETHILEETIESIRYHFPKSEIIITFDGVRDEQEKKRADYNDHIRRILWKSRFWGNIKPYVLEEHLHQSGMMKLILDEIKTPLILYVEQDTPLVTDEPIEWDLLKEAILSGRSNMIRFHHEAHIPKEHDSLMIGKPENKIQKTVQWSQRPHLASRAFYRRIMDENFSDNAKCFIEDLIHGKLHQSYVQDRKMGWEQWRTHIYVPNDKNIKRSYHTDGREGDEKFDETQVW